MTDISKLRKDLTAVAEELYERYLELRSKRKEAELDRRIKEYTVGSVYSVFNEIVRINEFGFPWRTYAGIISSLAKEHDTDEIIGRINSFAGIETTDPEDFADFIDQLKNDADLNKGFERFATEARACKEFLINSRNREYAPDDVGAHLFAMGYYTTLKHMQKIYKGAADK